MSAIKSWAEVHNEKAAMEWKTFSKINHLHLTEGKEEQWVFYFKQAPTVGKATNHLGKIRGEIAMMMSLRSCLEQQSI